MTSIDSTATTGVATTYASLQMGSGVATDKTSLGNDDFLNLLVKQMQNQDPSSPMDSSAIMQQTATLSQVESIQALTQLSQQQFGLQMRLGASNLVGQTVTYAGADGTTKTGTVTSASFATSTPTLAVDGTSVALDAVTGIAAASTPATGTPAGS
jgi:flagellar basal-body rod modification protein FlgD